MRELRSEGVKYKILQCLGEGESAAVFRASREDSQGHSRQTVALKILKDRTAVSRMRKEFEALASVNSPHCVRLLAWENLPEGAALVLEWIDGISLLQLARKRSLSTGQINEVLKQIQRGLRAIHELGLVHGDLSPSNVMIDRSGGVRLLDFGMPSTNSSEIRGTPAFLAPEIWSGQLPSAKSDLFALGLMAVDLSHGFSGSPRSIGECKERALKLANEGPGLLASEPQKRDFVRFDSRPEVKSEIGALVANVLDEAQSSSMRTQAFFRSANEPPGKRAPAIERVAWFRQYAVAVCMAIVAATAPVAADAPAGVEPIESGSIDIRADQWLKVSINGKSLGYAPISISNIQAGTHRIQWQGQKGLGEARIVLRPGARLRLDEKLLRLGQTLRNR